MLIVFSILMSLFLASGVLVIAFATGVFSIAITAAPILIIGKFAGIFEPKEETSSGLHTKKNIYLVEYKPVKDHSKFLRHEDTEDSVSSENHRAKITEKKQNISLGSFRCKQENHINAKVI